MGSTILYYALLGTGVFGMGFGIYLYINKSGKINNWPIATITLGISLITLQYVLFWSGLRVQYPLLYFYDHAWYLLFGPLFYTYVLKFYNNKINVGVTHFIPGLISLTLSIYYVVKTNGFFEMEPVKDEIAFKIMWNLRSAWLASFSMLTYLWFSIDYIKVSSYHSVQNRAFGLRKKWIRYLLFFYCLLILSYGSYWVLINNVPHLPMYYDILTIVMALSVFGIGYMVVKERSIFNGEIFSKLFVGEQGQRNTLSKSTKNEFYEIILNTISTEKLYRINTLRLVDLADKTGLPMHILSRIINEKSQKNFNQFINEFRIQEAEILLTQESSASVKSIYYDVGFNNKDTFYKAFRKKHNCTPLDYKRRHAM
ncbi:MAG: helix-turn-helix domain-containing protein [Flavobacteriaceae bacterium]|nr:helix-turn-helix domain-containing protein [Flavobacteriaceae bacterium]